MFELLKQLLDALRPDWKKKILGFTSDGASSMTGKNFGLATKIGEVAGDGFYRIWCAAHQLDQVVQKLTNTLLDENFFSVLQRMTGYLRRQKTLKLPIGFKCPNL